MFEMVVSNEKKAKMCVSTYLSAYFLADRRPDYLLAYLLACLTN